MQHNRSIFTSCQSGIFSQGKFPSMQTCILTRLLQSSDMAWRNSSPENENCHSLHTLLLFQTCKTFFLLWNIKDSLKNVSTVFVYPMKVILESIDIHWVEKNMKTSPVCHKSCRNNMRIRDGHFWQFLISIIDRFKKLKKTINRVLGGGGGGRGMAVMEIIQISEDCYKNYVKNTNMTWTHD